MYEYELDVLDELRELWYVHVPALLFHHSWPTRPMIGMQMGKPMEQDDMSLWEQVDLKKANDTVAKIKALGWEQRDLRGNSFVRLTDPDGVERIAMIDFEDVVRTEEDEENMLIDSSDTLELSDNGGIDEASMEKQHVDDDDDDDEKEEY